MCGHRHASVILGLLAFAVPLSANIARADTEAAVGSTETKSEMAEIPKADANAVAAKPVAKDPAAPRPAAAACSCEPVHAAVYVEDWGRLADLTRSDPMVFEKAEFWRSRQDTSRWVLGTGVILGGGAAALGTFTRLTSDSWSRSSKWCVAGGLGTALVSLLLNWAFSPDRDDLLTVINHWNIRHPDLLLAP
jgi:hypothetical protein